MGSASVRIRTGAVRFRTVDDEGQSSGKVGGGRCRRFFWSNLKSIFAYLWTLQFYQTVAKHQPEENSLVRKPGRPKRVETPLEKLKKEFTRLLGGIEKLKQEAQEREARLSEIRRRIRDEIKPLMSQVAKMRLEMNELLEKKLADKSFSRREKRTLIDLLFYNCDILERLFGLDMTEVRLRHLTKRERQQFETEEAEPSDDSFESGQPRADAAPEDEPPPNKRGRKKKTTGDGPQPDPVSPQVKKKLDLQRHLRSLYLTLAKLIHPDLEPDEEKKRQRTELMQKITTAYHHLDLYELLRARRDLLHTEVTESATKDPETENAEAEQLRQYVQILKSQRQEMESAHFMQNFLSPDTALLHRFHHPQQPLDKVFDKEKKVLKKEMDKISELRKILNHEEDARQYLEMVRDLHSLSGYF